MEHRHSRRIAIDIPVILYRNGERIAGGIARNISYRGVFVEVDGCEARRNEPLHIEIPRNGRRARRLRAAVVHDHGHGIGLEFLEVLEYSRNLVAEVFATSERADLEGWLLSA